MEKAKSLHIKKDPGNVHTFILFTDALFCGDRIMTSRYNETNSSSTIPNFVVPGPRLRFYEDSLGK